MEKAARLLSRGVDMGWAGAGAPQILPGAAPGKSRAARKVWFEFAKIEEVVPLKLW